MPDGQCQQLHGPDKNDGESDVTKECTSCKRDGIHEACSQSRERSRIQVLPGLMWHAPHTKVADQKKGRTGEQSRSKRCRDVLGLNPPSECEDGDVRGVVKHPRSIKSVTGLCFNDAVCECSAPKQNDNPQPRRSHHRAAPNARGLGEKIASLLKSAKEGR